MANNVLKSTLEARIIDLEYQIKHGKLDPKIALTALMEETVAECVVELEKHVYDDRDEWESAIYAAMNAITIKD